MVNMMLKFQVPSFYGLGMVKKIHVRGNSIENRQFFSIAWGKTGAQKWCKGTKEEFGWFLSASYIPLANINLFGQFQSFQSSAKVHHFCSNQIYTIICPISDMSRTTVSWWWVCNHRGLPRLVYIFVDILDLQTTPKTSIVHALGTLIKYLKILIFKV